MDKYVFFTALKDIKDDDGGPVSIAGTNCRFLKGKHYAISERGNAELISALRVGVKGGDFKELDAADGFAKVTAQDAAFKAEKAARKESDKANNVNAPAGRAAATIDSGPAGA